MPELIVLGDAIIHDILINLEREDIVAFREEISKTLDAFSTSDEREYQPEPAVITRPDGRKALYRPFTAPNGVGIKVVVDPPRYAPTTPNGSSKDATTTSAKPVLHGFLAVCDEDGQPKGFANAEEITAYRTSMSAMIPYSWRTDTANIVVFGAGKTALWHIRQALGLRGEEIKRITVVNRSLSSAEELITQVQQENEKLWKSSVVFQALGHDHSRYEEELRDKVAHADNIFCTTPSTRPVFPASYLALENGEQRPCFVSGIGSWQPEMAEIDPALLVKAATSSNGAVVVDDREGAFKSAGEVIQSKLTTGQVKELGALLHMRDHDQNDFSNELERCLSKGLVVYKSVGVSLTDLAAGNALLALARKQDKGVVVPQF